MAGLDSTPPGDAAGQMVQEKALVLEQPTGKAQGERRACSGQAMSGGGHSRPGSGGRPGCLSA